MRSLLLAMGLLLVFAGLFGIVAIALGARFGSDRTKGRLASRLKGYSAQSQAVVTPQYAATSLGNNQMTRRAVGAADKLAADRGFEENLADSLDAAAVPLRPGEWMLLHAASTLGLGLVLLSLSSFSLVAGIIGVAVGFGLPYGFLAFKRERRRNAFYSELPETLQMISGSLSSGYSLPQAVDAVVHETSGPMADELNRALIEVRLGAALEDALDAVAVRMHSTDMAWVVMAIRIQHEVGGNLAEVLLTVAGTLRERERLRRQVSVLSAEGRLSAAILGALPILVALVLAVIRPEYLSKLFTSPLGWLMIITAGVIFLVGIVWMSKAIKVEV